MIKITLYGWKIKEADRQLYKRILDTLKVCILKNNKEDNVTYDWDQIEDNYIDVATYGEVDHDEGWGIVFGRAIKQVNDHNGLIFSLPGEESLASRPENKAYRESALDTLKEIAAQIFLHSDSLGYKEPTQILVRKDNITIGREVGDIVIAEEELEYIKKIRDLLGGGSIEITKGDLKIKIKNTEKDRQLPPA